VARSYPNLVRLSVRDTDVTDESIKNVASMCPKLKYLSISECTFLTDDSVLAVSRGCPEIEEFRMSGCEDLTDVSVVAMAQSCHNLKTICLDWCRITNVSLVALAKFCPNLKMVRLCGWMDTTWGIEELKKLPSNPTVEYSKFE
jgi:hypothetical protein